MPSLPGSIHVTGTAVSATITFNDQPYKLVPYEMVLLLNAAFFLAWGAVPHFFDAHFEPVRKSIPYQQL